MYGYTQEQHTREQHTGRKWLSTRGFRSFAAKAWKSNPPDPPHAGNRHSLESYRSAEEYGPDIQKLREENKELRQRVQELEYNEGLMNEIRVRETMKHREPHDAISGQFSDVFQQCRRWASAYFGIEIAEFDIKGFREFEKEVGLISFVDSESIKRKECFGVSHLVQGVLGNILAVEIFKSPFQGCANEFRDEYSRHYKFMLDMEDRAEAHRWRARSLTAYYGCESWALKGKEPKLVESYREEHVKEIFHRVNSALTPVTKYYFPHQTKEISNAQNEGLTEIIREAKMLGEKMSQQGSELVAMDKRWFEKQDRTVDLTSGWVQARLVEEDDAKSGMNWRVDIILAPGFLKYGDDDSENLDQRAVWARAAVDVQYLPG